VSASITPSWTATEHAAVEEMRRFRQIGVGIEMNERQRAVPLGMSTKRGIAREVIPTEPQRRHVMIDELRHGFLNCRDHVFSTAREPQDIAAIDQAEAFLEGVVMRPAFVIEADVAGLFADRAGAESSTGTI
jgi:hypothetical protein